MVGVDIPFDIIAIAAAIAFMLSWLAAQSMFKPLLNGLADTLGPVGAALAFGGDFLLQKLVQGLSPWADTAITPLSRTFGTAVQRLNVWMGAAVTTVEALGAAIVVNAAGAASSAVQTAIDTAEQYARDIVQTVANDAQVYAQNAINQAIALVGGVTLELRNFEQYVGQELASLQAGIQSTVSAQVSQLTLTLQQEIASAEQEAQSIEAGLSAKVDAAVASIDGAVESAAERAVATLAPDVADLVRRVPAVEGEVAALAPAVAAVTATAAATAATLAKELEECITPLCNTYHDDIPIVQDVLNLFAAGALAAILAAAITDPDGTAHAADGVFGGFISEADGIVRSLGVHA